MTWEQIIQKSIDSGAAPKSVGRWNGIARYGEWDDEYRAEQSGAGIHDRSYRGLLEITGGDRAAWLHNLTTNHVQNLQPGDGNYAFACNVKGRILFDLNILVQTDSIWLDIDHRWIDAARQHLEKHIIVEDVSISDRSHDFVRLAMSGSGTPDCLSRFGCTNAAAMAQLQTGRISVGGLNMPFFRHDFCGPSGIELFAPAGRATDIWHALCDQQEVIPVGYDAIDALRIEAGLPWPFTEITDQVLPAETDQQERAVTFNKGCYLGQEIVERMRAHDSIARKLVLLRVDGDVPPSPGATLSGDGKTVGQVTSSCYSPRNDSPIALGYVRTGQATDGTVLQVKWDSCNTSCRVVAIDKPH
ncbi:MAG: folate-binding protein YgfZ [Planctomycetes bacterium]|nr:folate-binding protein YgfZ [Planctomycetota bacterium]